MKKIATLLFYTVFVLGLAMTMPEQVQAQGADGYAGEARCQGCHTGPIGGHPAIFPEYEKSGHRYKLNAVDGAAPTYPEGRLYYPLVGDPFAPAAVTPPDGTTWADFAYVIGGYGWKARFVQTDGRIWTGDATAQQNLWNNSRVEYHLGDPNKLYDYGCFKCHTTGGTPDGSWSDDPNAAPNLGDFTDPGVTCEGCHGPSEAHADGAFADPPVLPPNTGDVLRLERCIECHQRGGATNAILAKGGYIRHHEQGNEFRASRHGDGLGEDLTCISCHNPHVALHYPDLAGEGYEGITTTCESAGCHEDAKYDVQLNGASKGLACATCHMPKVTKSALGMQTGNGWIGDVKTHIMAINTAPVLKTEAMFTADGSEAPVTLVDGRAAVTMDFTCLQCHSNKDVQWAANYAQSVHAGGIHTASEDLADLPKEYELLQNYPNPFNPKTTIRFDLPETADVTIDIFSVDGRLVKSMLNQRMPAGDHQLTINAENLASGNYIYRLKAGDFTQSKTMTLLK